MFDDRPNKSEVRKRMEAFYEEMSKNKDLLAFLTGMAAETMGEDKVAKEPQQPEEK
jgi:hypothetical protein